jgi:growth arrest-specific protein 8
MPAKKKAKGKPKKEEVVVEETEYDNMDLEMLQEVVPMLKQQLEKSMLDRNYVQLERDTIQTFYDISRKEASDLGMNISAKDRAMELMEDNHRVEVRVYVQKVKHLEYEHKNNLTHIAAEGQELLGEEATSHNEREQDLKLSKRELKNELAERETYNAEEIAQVKEAQFKNLTKMREGFDASLQQLRDRCEERLGQLEMDLELRRKVDIHEIEVSLTDHCSALVHHDGGVVYLMRYDSNSNCKCRAMPSACRYHCKYYQHSTRMPQRGHY